MMKTTPSRHHPRQVSDMALVANAEGWTVYELPSDERSTEFFIAPVVADEADGVH